MRFSVDVAGLLITTVVTAVTCGCSGAPGQCGTADANHCYAVAQWEHPPAISVIQLQITATSMTPGDGYHITAEAWLTDNFGNWIEIGEIARNGENPVYFWADRRPGHDFAEHDLTQVAPQQLGWPVFYEIYKDGQNTFHISTGVYGGSYSGLSTDNTMVPTRWSVGQEMAGSTNGASADRATYQNLIAVDLNGGIHSEKTAPRVKIDKPPFGFWADSPPLTGDVFPGQDLVQSGTFQTSCCAQR